MKGHRIVVGWGCNRPRWTSWSVPGRCGGAEAAGGARMRRWRGDLGSEKPERMWRCLLFAQNGADSIDGSGMRGCVAARNETEHKNANSAANASVQSSPERMRSEPMGARACGQISAVCAKARTAPCAPSVERKKTGRRGVRAGLGRVVPRGAPTKWLGRWRGRIASPNRVSPEGSSLTIGTAGRSSAPL